METLPNWENPSCLWVGRINIIKMHTLLKVIYRFNATLFKISMIFFQYPEKMMLSFCGNSRDPK